ncbi:FMRFamide receptor [Orchesella cincta]|uniref:FMRFamide receptor n=1 Tax=Orchesella cincta TaxID=48709 RepID=A0A1D2MRQ9_ORCCI|nr:FMRFamide receptor [Orchesella cincta]
MGSTANQSVEYLHMDMCHMLDLPANGRDCSIQNPTLCIECKIPGKFMTGETMTEFHSAGHIVCFLMGFLTVGSGVLGLFTNSIIIAVIKKRKKYHPFDFLIKVLACIDLYACGAAVIGQLARMALYGNWVQKGYSTLQWYMASTNAALFGRSASTHLALLITVERFLVIAFPLRSRTWFTPVKTAWLAFGVSSTSVILNVPRFLNYKVTYNGYLGEDEILGVRDFEYLVRTTDAYTLFYRTMGNAHGQIDFWMPLPILSLFNILSFIQARKLTKRRENINRVQRKEIEALRLFLPVVIVLFATNVAPFVHFIVIRFCKTLYRELSTAMMFSIAINSSVNFHLYYNQNLTFKKEAKNLIRRLCGVEVEKDTTSRRELSYTTTGL